MTSAKDSELKNWLKSHAPSAITQGQAYGAWSVATKILETLEKMFPGEVAIERTVAIKHAGTRPGQHGEYSLPPCKLTCRKGSDVYLAPLSSGNWRIIVDADTDVSLHCSVLNLFSPSTPIDSSKEPLWVGELSWPNYEESKQKFSIPEMPGNSLGLITILASIIQQLR